MEAYSLDEIREHNSEESAWLLHKGRVFDVTKFISHHPGGRNVLLPKFGSDVTEIMQDTQIHKHTAFAFNMMNKYCIGKLSGQNESHDEDEELNMEGYKENELVDWSKPMVAQVGKLGSEYLKWVHSPVNRPLRLFGPEIVEFFSKTPWYMVPIVWLPVVLYLCTIGLTHLANDLGGFLTNVYSIFLMFVCLFILGTVLWTLVEYLLHRHLFHITPPDDSPFWITFHFFIHGQHHKVPFDSGRLVFPPVAASVFAVLFYSLFISLLPYGIANSVFAGGLFGYVMYDCIHYYLHHGSPNHGSYFHNLKSYHVAHHFEDSNKGYGISSKLWDFPFKTRPMKFE